MIAILPSVCRNIPHTRRYGHRAVLSTSFANRVHNASRTVLEHRSCASGIAPPRTRHAPHLNTVQIGDDSLPRDTYPHRSRVGRARIAVDTRQGAPNRRGITGIVRQERTRGHPPRGSELQSAGLTRALFAHAAGLYTSSPRGCAWYSLTPIRCPFRTVTVRYFV